MVRVSEKMMEEMNKMICIQKFQTVLDGYKKEGSNKKLKEYTQSDYKYEIRLFYNQLGLSHDQLPTKEMALKWRVDIEKRYKSKKTQCKKIPPLNLFLEKVCGFEHKMLETIDNVTRSKTPTKITRKQVMDMVDYAESIGKYTYAAMIYTTFVTATRKDVLHRIELDHLDFENNTVLLKNAKGNVDHVVVLAKEEMDYIKDYVENHRPNPAPNNVNYKAELFRRKQKGLPPLKNGVDHAKYLFLMLDGRKVYEDKLAYVLKRCAKGIGLKVSIHPHSLRRALINYLYHEQKWTLSEIKCITGHKDIAYLLPYIDEGNLDKVQAKRNAQYEHEQPEPTTTPISTNNEKTDLDKQIELKKLEIRELELRASINNEQIIHKEPHKLNADRNEYGGYSTI